MQHDRPDIVHIPHVHISNISIKLPFPRIPCTRNSRPILAFVRNGTPDMLSRPISPDNLHEKHDCTELLTHRPHFRPSVPSTRDTWAILYDQLADYCRSPIRHRTPKRHDTMNPVQVNCTVHRCTFCRIPLPIQSNETWLEKRRRSMGR